MAEIKIAAENRTEFGKGAARRIRRADKVPAVLYGSGIDPTHITLPGHDLALALKNSNALLSIALGSDTHLCIPKQVQRDPLRGVIEHADLLLVKKGQKVTVDVAIHVEGEAAPETLVVVDRNSIPIEAEATHIPTQIVVSIEGLSAGTLVLAKDLALPSGSVLGIDPETLIVNVTGAQSEAAAEAELAEAEAEAGIEPTIAEGDVVPEEGDGAATTGDAADAEQS